MSQPGKWNIPDSFFAFWARILQQSRENRIRRQMKCLPPHLIDDVNALPTVDEARGSIQIH